MLEEINMLGLFRQLKMKAFQKKGKDRLLFLLPGWLIVILGTLTILLSFSLLHKTIDSIVGRNTLFHHTIIIDPGHGGIDGGTYDRDIMLLEKDINLEIALLVKEMLELNDIHVIMTRDEDISLEDKSPLKSTRHQRDLDARRRIIDSNNGCLFVSIHVDARPQNPNARGATIFYNYKSEEGKNMAEEIKKSVDSIVYYDLLNKESIKSRIQPGNYYILKTTKIPGALVETGFITNLEEKQLFQDLQFKRQIALAIGDGIIRYLLKSQMFHQCSVP